MPQRDSLLSQEMIRQQNNERLRRQFAQKANVVGQWIERHLDAIASISMQKGTLEDQLRKLKGYEQEVVNYKPNIDELERYNQVSNQHIPYVELLHGYLGISHIFSIQLY